MNVKVRRPPAVPPMPAAESGYHQSIRDAVLWLLDNHPLIKQPIAQTNPLPGVPVQPPPQFGATLLDQNGNIVTQVDSGLIADDAVTSTHLANGAVTGPAIANGEIGQDHIGTGAIHGDHLQVRILGDEHLQDDRVLIRSDHASGNVSYNYRGVWSNLTAYVIGDEVVYGTSYWVAVANSTNSAPSTGNANWQVVGTYSGFQGAWSAATAYVAGAEVTYSGNYWVCLVANTNSAPAIGNANWQIAGPTNLDNVANGVNRGAVLVTELAGAGTIKQLNDGVNTRTASDVGAVVAVGGNIQSTTKIAGRTEQIGTTVTKLNSSGLLVDADQIAADGATFVRHSGQQRNTGSVSISNGLFQQGSGQVSLSNFVLPGWETPGTGDAYFQSASPSPQFGTQYLVLKSTAVVSIEIDCKTKWACRPGDNVTIGGTVAEFGAPTEAQVFVDFLDKNMAYLGGVAYNPGLTTFSQGQATATAPANTAWALPGIYLNPTAANQYGLFNEIWMSINDVRVVGGGVLGGTGNIGANNVTFNNMKGDTSGDTGTSLIDAGNKRFLHATMSTGVQGVVSSTSQVNVNPSGGVTGTLPGANNGLTIAGSTQQLGDPRNSVAITASGLRAQWDGAQLSSAAYPAATPTNQKIILSGTLYCGGATISYGPTTLLGLPNTTTPYWVFVKDPTMAGGSPTLYASGSDPNTNGSNTYSKDNGYIFVGKITTQAGTTGSGSGGGGLPP